MSLADDPGHTYVFSLSVDLSAIQHLLARQPAWQAADDPSKPPAGVGLTAAESSCSWLQPLRWSIELLESQLVTRYGPHVALVVLFLGLTLEVTLVNVFFHEGPPWLVWSTLAFHVLGAMPVTLAFFYVVSQRDLLGVIAGSLGAFDFWLMAACELMAVCTLCWSLWVQHPEYHDGDRLWWFCSACSILVTATIPCILLMLLPDVAPILPRAIRFCFVALFWIYLLVMCSLFMFVEDKALDAVLCLLPDGMSNCFTLRGLSLSFFSEMLILSTKFLLSMASSRTLCLFIRTHVHMRREKAVIGLTCDVGRAAPEPLTITAIQSATQREERMTSEHESKSSHGCEHSVPSANGSTSSSVGLISSVALDEWPRVMPHHQTTTTGHNPPMPDTNQHNDNDRLLQQYFSLASGHTFAGADLAMQVVLCSLIGKWNACRSDAPHWLPQWCWRSLSSTATAEAWLIVSVVAACSSFYALMYTSAGLLGNSSWEYTAPLFVFYCGTTTLYWLVVLVNVQRQLAQLVWRSFDFIIVLFSSLLMAVLGIVLRHQQLEPSIWSEDPARLVLAAVVLLSSAPCIPAAALMVDTTPALNPAWVRWCVRIGWLFALYQLYTSLFVPDAALDHLQVCLPFASRVCMGIRQMQTAAVWQLCMFFTKFVFKMWRYPDRCVFIRNSVHMVQ